MRIRSRARFLYTSVLNYDEIRRSVCVTHALINGKAAALIERQADNNIPRGAYLLMVFSIASENN